VTSHFWVIQLRSAHWGQNQQFWSILYHQDRQLKCFLTLFLQYMPGFKSRWMILNLCKYWIPSRIDFIIIDTSESLNLRFLSNLSFMSCLSVPPAIYYIIRYRLDSVYLKELNFTIFLCSIDDNISAYFLKLFNRCLVKSCLWNIWISVCNTLTA
jgi:hypothetical protein